mgnify:CR=1 FL=1
MGINTYRLRNLWISVQLNEKLLLSLQRRRKHATRHLDRDIIAHIHVDAMICIMKLRTSQRLQYKLKRQLSNTGRLDIIKRRG